MTLLLLGKYVMRRWRIAAAVALALFAGAMLFFRTLPDEYSANTVVSFSPRRGSGVGAAELRAILPKYVTYITSRSTLVHLAPVIGETPDKLTAGVDARIVSDTSNLAITVTLDDPDQAAAAANLAAKDIAYFAGSDPLFQARLVAEALPPSDPSGPPRTLLALAALLVSALLGAVTAVVLERARPRVRTWPDVRSATGQQVVGRLPASRHLQAASADSFGDAEFSDAVRSIRTNLAHLASQHGAHVLLVTSSLPGEGKTTVATALAVALARLDRDVLLVDADLHRRGLSRLFGLRPGTDPGQRPGLAAVLRGEAELRRCLRPGPVPRLSILPTSRDSEGGDLLARRFDRVLDQARENFEVVVVDGPPLLAGNDAGTLATQCDATLLVIASGTPVYSAAEAAAALEALGVRVLGAVANRAREPWALGRYLEYADDANVKTPQL